MAKKMVETLEENVSFKRRKVHPFNFFYFIKEKTANQFF